MLRPLLVDPYQSPALIYLGIYAEALVPGGLEGDGVHDVGVPVHHALLDGVLHTLLHAPLQHT